MSFRNRLKFPALIVIALATLGLSDPSTAQDAGRGVVVTVSPDVHYQQMKGWEATVETEWAPDFQENRDEMFRRAVEEVGITRVRVGIFAGSTENTDRSFERWKSGEITSERFRQLRYSTKNDNSDPFTINPDGFDFANLDWRIDNYVLPMKRLLEARGEKLFVNVNYVAFTKQSREGNHKPTYHHDDPEEYAEFVLATYLHMRDTYGFVPDAWEVILEPDLVTEWRRDPRLIGKAMVAAARRLRENGFVPSFIAPSVTDMSNAQPYLMAILSVPGAREVLSEVSYHRYRGSSEAVLEQLAAVAGEFGLAPAMLEYWFGKADEDVLYEDLTVGRNEVWAGRTISGNFRMLPRGMRMKKDVRNTSLYMAFVRPGAMRIGAETSSRGARALAFDNPDGSRTVVTKLSAPAVVRFEGLDPGAYLGFFVSPKQCGAAIPLTVDDDGALEVRMPEQGTLAVTSYSRLSPEFLSKRNSSRC